MDKPGLLFQDWTYTKAANFIIVAILDIMYRFEVLMRNAPRVIPHWWGESFLQRYQNRLAYREGAAKVRMRHELIKYCSICDDDDL